MKRRKFIADNGRLILGLTAASGLSISCNSKTAGKEKEITPMENNKPTMKLSLAQWSLHKQLFDNSIDHLDFAAKARSFGLDGIEYVSQFFKDEVENVHYLSEMITRANDAHVDQLLIMVDGEGDLASAKEQERMDAVSNHKKWIDAAKYLGCHSIRVNLFGELYDLDAWIGYATHGLGNLCEYGAKEGINVIVENHGWLSSNAAALVQVMKQVDSDFCGTLPDFGNFCTRRPDGKLWGPECDEEYDKYQGVDEMMPYAKAVSAKSHDFDEAGNETTIDFSKMMDILKKHNYEGFIGVEYEGSRFSEDEGIVATRDLLKRLI